MDNFLWIKILQFKSWNVQLSCCVTFIPTSLVVLITDANQIGTAAVLNHYCNEQVIPIACVFRSFTSFE